MRLNFTFPLADVHTPAVYRQDPNKSQPAIEMLNAGVKPALCSFFGSAFPSGSVNNVVAGAVSAMTFKFPSAEQFSATTLEPPHPGKIASNLPSVNIACDTEFARTRGVYVAIFLSSLTQLRNYT
jgi:hypothetical protein